MIKKRDFCWKKFSLKKNEMLQLFSKFQNASEINIKQLDKHINQFLVYLGDMTEYRNDYSEIKRNGCVNSISNIFMAPHLGESGISRKPAGRFQKDLRHIILDI